MELKPIDKIHNYKTKNKLTKTKKQKSFTINSQTNSKKKVKNEKAKTNCVKIIFKMKQ